MKKRRRGTTKRRTTRNNSSQRNNRSGNAQSGQSRKKRNKHHIIFPESLCNQTKEWRELRSMFIINIDQDLHVHLHQHLDRYISASNKVFLKKETAEYLLRECSGREKAIKRMKPIVKIKWLRKKLDQYNRKHNGKYNGKYNGKDSGNDSKWLHKMLSAQIVFLQAHKEEI